MADAPILAALLVDAIRDLRAVSAERERYRLGLQQAIHQLHDQHVELSRLRERLHRSLNEGRELRAELRRYTASAAVGRAA